MRAAHDARRAGAGGGLAAGPAGLTVLQRLDQLRLQHAGLAHGAGHAVVGHAHVALDHNLAALGLGLQRHRDLQPRLGQPAEDGQLTVDERTRPFGKGGCAEGFGQDVGGGHVGTNSEQK